MVPQVRARSKAVPFHSDWVQMWTRRAVRKHDMLARGTLIATEAAGSILLARPYDLPLADPEKSGESRSMTLTRRRRLLVHRSDVLLALEGLGVGFDVGVLDCTPAERPDALFESVVDERAVAERAVGFRNGGLVRNDPGV